MGFSNIAISQGIQLVQYRHINAFNLIFYEFGLYILTFLEYKFIVTQNAMSDRNLWKVNLDRKRQLSIDVLQRWSLFVRRRIIC